MRLPTAKALLRAIPIALYLVPILAGGVATPPAHAAPSLVDGLAIYVGYAEDKETNNPNPAAFPVPWAGAPNTVFLGNPVTGQSNCGTLPQCYDAGAIRLDNPGTSPVA